MRSAWVIGSRGQDGRLLTEQLRAAGVRVIGVDRTGVDLWEGEGDHEFWHKGKRLTPGSRRSSVVGCRLLRRLISGHFEVLVAPPPGPA